MKIHVETEIEIGLRWLRYGPIAAAAAAAAAQEQAPTSSSFFPRLVKSADQCVGVVPTDTVPALDASVQGRQCGSRHAHSRVADTRLECALNALHGR